MDYLEYLAYDLAARIYTGDKLKDYGDGKWITVGKRDENKNIEGKGTHIFVKGKGLNARIVKGPAGIAGKRMKNLLYNHVKTTKGNMNSGKKPGIFNFKNKEQFSNPDFYQSQPVGTKISSRNDKDRTYYKKTNENKWEKYKWDSQKKKFIKAGAGILDKTMANKGFNAQYYKLTNSSNTSKQVVTNPEPTLKSDPTNTNPVANSIPTASKTPNNKLPNGEIHPTLDKLMKSGITYNPIEKHKKQLTHEEIVQRISGGDLTHGSCASLALAYAANRAGYNVLDFRDGESRKFFGNKENIANLYTDHSVDPPVMHYKKFDYEYGQRVSTDHAWRALQTMEEGKEYHLSYAQHSSIVRRVGNKFQYLELQASDKYGDYNGWHDLKKPDLRKRFSNRREALYVPARLYDISEIVKCPGFFDAMGYINTPESEQRKGPGGTIK